jgi:hypothetical protein
LPVRPVWFHRLDEILSELRYLEASHLDRQAVEKLFQVRERRARQLMACLPCLRIGNAIAVERTALLRWLEEVAVGDPFRRELSRRARIADALDLLREQAAAQRVRIPASRDARNRTFRNLAPGIQLRLGELRIEFSSAQDLAAKLFELSQAMANDWQGLVRRLEV